MDCLLQTANTMKKLSCSVFSMFVSLLGPTDGRACFVSERSSAQVLASFSRRLSASLQMFSNDFEIPRTGNQPT